jgi:enoyl-CoA hydratase/carnithine racemase
MSTSAIRVEARPDGVTVLTIDQPGSKVNILTDALWSELDAAVDALATRADVKGLVIASGKPGIFIAGADIQVFANAPGPNDPTVQAFVQHGLRVLEKLEALPFPTCAAIDGAALGGGLEVALACDFRIGGSSAKLQVGFPEVKLGLIPGWGGTQRLPRLISRRTNFFGKLLKAVEVVTSGQGLGVMDAVPLGLFDAVVDSESLIDHAAWNTSKPDRMDRRVADRGRLPEDDWPFPIPIPDEPAAAREATRVMIEGATLLLSDAIKLETEAFLRLAGSDESKRLIAEFFTSRKK